MPGRRTSSSAHRPVRPSPPCCAPGCRRPTCSSGAVGCRCRPRARPSSRGAGSAHREPRPPRQRASGSMASPARLARAARAPWAVTPGSLAAAVMPAGQVVTADMAVPFDNLYGDGWPEPHDVDRGRAARHRSARGVRAAGRAGGPGRGSRAGVVRHPGVLRTGGDRRRALRRRRRALDDERRPRCRRATRPRARQRPDVSGARHPAPRSDERGAALRRPVAGPRGRRPARQGHHGRDVPADERAISR